MKIIDAKYTDHNKNQVLVKYDNGKVIAIPPSKSDPRYVEAKKWSKEQGKEL